MMRSMRPRQNSRLKAAARQIAGAAFAFLVALQPGCRNREMHAEGEPPPIEINAVVHPSQSMTIAAQIDGRVESVAVRAGQAIRANDEMVRLANPSVERDAAIAQAQLAWIDARIARSGHRSPSAPAQSASGLDLAQRILDLRRQRFETMKQLRKSNDITARELEQAEIEYLAALRDYNNERRAAAAGTSSNPADSSLLRIERQKAAAEEQFAAHRRSLLRVTSPISGIITGLHVAPGQTVFPRDLIADVSDVATLHVRGEVAPELLRYIRRGMRVDVKILSVPPRTFADEIENVIPVQASASGSRAATVVVSIPNPDGSLQPNTQALITLRSLR